MVGGWPPINYQIHSQLELRLSWAVTICKTSLKEHQIRGGRTLIKMIYGGDEHMLYNILGGTDKLYVIYREGVQTIDIYYIYDM